MYHLKKIAVLCFVLCCFAIMFCFLSKEHFYIHNEKMPIKGIRIVKIFSTPGIEGKDIVENITLYDKKEIDDVISKLKSYSFYKTISLEKITGITSTTEDMTQFFIYIQYDTGRQQNHIDSIDVVCTEHMTWKKVLTKCGNKQYHGKVSNKTMQQFLEDMQIYFDNE